MTSTIPIVCPYCGVGCNLELALDENDTVRMTSPHGTVLLPLKLEASMQPGYLFAPIHFSEPNFNALMSAVPIDPKARMPALKVVPVKIQKEKCK